MKITKDMKLAMARYYINQQKQGWNKLDDLKHIDIVASKYKFGLTAVAGTFWFDYYTKSGKPGLIECNSSNFLSGGVRIKQKGQKNEELSKCRC